MRRPVKWSCCRRPSPSAYVSACRLARQNSDRHSNQRVGRFAVPRQNSDLPSNQLIKLCIQIGLSPCQTGPMLRLLRLFVVLVTRLFRSRRDLVLENPTLPSQCLSHWLRATRRSFTSAASESAGSPGNPTAARSFRNRLIIGMLFPVNDVGLWKFHLMRKFMAKLSSYAAS